MIRRVIRSLTAWLLVTILASARRAEAIFPPFQNLYCTAPIIGACTGKYFARTFACGFAYGTFGPYGTPTRIVDTWPQRYILARQVEKSLLMGPNLAPGSTPGAFFFDDAGQPADVRDMAYGYTFVNFLDLYATLPGGRLVILNISGQSPWDVTIPSGIQVHGEFAGLSYNPNDGGAMYVAYPDVGGGVTEIWRVTNLRNPAPTPSTWTLLTTVTGIVKYIEWHWTGQYMIMCNETTRQVMAYVPNMAPLTQLYTPGTHVLGTLPAGTIPQGITFGTPGALGKLVYISTRVGAFNGTFESFDISGGLTAAPRTTHCGMLSGSMLASRSISAVPLGTGALAGVHVTQPDSILYVTDPPVSACEGFLMPGTSYQYGPDCAVLTLDAGGAISSPTFASSFRNTMCDARKDIAANNPDAARQKLESLLTQINSAEKAGKISTPSADVLFGSVQAIERILPLPASPVPSPACTGGHLRLAAPSVARMQVAFTVTVTAFDRFGNQEAQFRGTIQFTSTDPYAVLPPPYTFPSTLAGSQKFQVTLKTPGKQIITVRQSGASCKAPGTATVFVSSTCDFVPGGISTTAGTGVAGYNGDGGAATAAQMNRPVRASYDLLGNLYIADSGNHRIRKTDMGTGAMSTVAGTGVAGYNGDGIPASTAQLNNPAEAVAAFNGDVYIAEYSGHRVRRISGTTGLMSTVAGTGVAGFGGDGGPATAAQLFSPTSVQVNASGDLFITDYLNHRVRKVAAGTGVISTVAGTGGAGYNGDGIPATTAHLNQPSACVLDVAGNLYIDDQFNHRVRKVAASTGLISTLAGTGVAGYNGDGVAGTAAQLNYPSGIALDGSGNVFVGDQFNNRVRKIHALTGLISTVAGTGVLGYNGDGLPATSAELHEPTGVAFDLQCRLTIADSNNHRVRRINQLGPPGLSSAVSVVPHPVRVGTGFRVVLTVTNTGAETLLGVTPGLSTPSGGGLVSFVSGPAPAMVGSLAPAAVASFTWTYAASGVGFATFLGTTFGTAAVSGLTVSTSHSATQHITAGPCPDPAGTVGTVAGTGTAGYNGDGIAATAAQLNGPSGQVSDAAGNLYVAELLDHRVRKVSAATGLISTVAGTGVAGFNGDGIAATGAQLNGPSVVTLDTAGNLYVSETFGHRVRRVDAASGLISTVAGTGTGGYNGDGIAATAAQVTSPAAIVFDALGNLHISDNANHRVRKVTATTGMISTVAGTGAGGYNGDGIQASAAQLQNPSGIVFDATGALYVADQLNHRIRKVDAATGLISTIAGTGTAGYNGDGIAATAALLNNPGGVAVNGSGNLFFTDVFNERVRRIDGVSGQITTVAGTGVAGYNGDGIAATTAQVSTPAQVSFDAQCRMLFTDFGNHRVRRIALPPAVRFVVAAPSVVVRNVTFTLTVTAVDANGIVVTDYTGTASFTSTDRLATVPPNTAFTLANQGTRLFTVTLRTAGVIFLTVKDTLVPTLSGSASINVVCAQTTGRFRISLPLIVSSGVPFSMTVTAINQNGTVNSTFNGTVAFTTTDPTAVITPPTFAYAPANGGRKVFVATLSAPCLRTISAYQTGVVCPITGSATVNVDASGLIAAFAVPVAVPVGNPFEVTVTVTNTGAGPVTSVMPSLEVNAGNVSPQSGPTPPALATLPTGAAQTFTWVYEGNAVGTALFTMTVTGSSCGGAIPLRAAGSVAVTLTPASCLPADTWSRDFNGSASGDDQPNEIAVDSAGNVIAAGWALTAGQSNNWTIRKYDSAGTLLWARDYNGAFNGSDLARGVAVDTGDNVIVAGTADGDLVVRKYDSAGTLLWMRTFNDPLNADDFATAVATAPNNDIVVVGREQYGPTAHRWIIRRYDAAGNLLWSQTYNHPAQRFDTPYAVAVNSAGDAIIVGDEEFGFSVYRWVVRAYNAAGTFLWSDVFQSGSNPQTSAQGVAVDASGNVYVAGNTLTSGQGYDWVVRKYAPGGSLAWTQGYNDPTANTHDVAFGVAVNACGEVLVAGGTSRPDLGQSDNWLVRKYDPAGGVFWQVTHDGPANGGETAYGVRATANGFVVAGTERRSDVAQGWNWEIKAPTDPCACTTPTAPGVPLVGTLSDLLVTATAPFVPLIQSASAEPRYPVRGRSRVAVAYTLSADAEVSVVLVETTNGAEAMPRMDARAGAPGGTAGRNEISWDGRDRHGHAVAPGRYAVELLARSGEGRTERRRLWVTVRPDGNEAAGLPGPRGSPSGEGASAGAARESTGSGRDGAGASGGAGGKSNNGVRDHGQGEGRDGRGQGVGKSN